MRHTSQQNESSPLFSTLDAWVGCCMELAMQRQRRHEQSPWRVRREAKLLDVFNEALIERLSDGPDNEETESLISLLRHQAGFFFREAVVPVSTQEALEIVSRNDIFQESEGRVYGGGSFLARWASNRAEGKKTDGDASAFKAHTAYYFFKLFLMNQSVCDETRKERAFLAFENNREEFEGGFRLILDAIEGQGALGALPVEKRIEQIPDLLLTQAMGRTDLTAEIFAGKKSAGDVARRLFVAGCPAFLVEPRTWRLGRLLVDAVKAAQDKDSSQGPLKLTKADGLWLADQVRAYQKASDTQQKTASYLEIAEVENRLLSRYRPLSARPDLRSDRPLFRKRAECELSVR